MGSMTQPRTQSRRSLDLTLEYSLQIQAAQVNAINGNKSTAEHLAKNLRQKMERDEKKFKSK
jgi:hypothetical protein